MQGLGPAVIQGKMGFIFLFFSIFFYFLFSIFFFCLFYVFSNLLVKVTIPAARRPVHLS